MNASFCIDYLEEAIRLYGAPEIFNLDQGSQFTSDAFIAVLLLNGICISMDGRGRAFDNIFVERFWRSLKHEDTYLKGYATLPEPRVSLMAYFSFYNTERPHQALGYQTPETVYLSGQGGGALIIDKFSDKNHVIVDGSASIMSLIAH